MERGVELAELPLAVLRAFHPALDESVLLVLDPEVAIERRTGFGGPSSERVKQAILAAKALLEQAQGLSADPSHS